VNATHFKQAGSRGFSFGRYLASKTGQVIGAEHKPNFIHLPGLGTTLRLPLVLQFFELRRGGLFFPQILDYARGMEASFPAKVLDLRVTFTGTTVVHTLCAGMIAFPCLSTAS